MNGRYWQSEGQSYCSCGNLLENLSSTYVQAAEEVLVDRGQIFLPFLDDYFIPFSVILRRSSAVAKFQARILTSLTEITKFFWPGLQEPDDFSGLC